MRKSTAYYSPPRSHAPAWECSVLRSCVAARDAGASGMRSHAGAWEREEIQMRGNI
jgi:hypothetical protein